MLLRTPSGDLYTTTYAGGAYGAGAVIKLSANGQETVLHSFTGGADGGYPQSNGSLIQDQLGNLYGVTFGGGTYPYGCGVIFKLSPSGTETVLHTFNCSDGANPLGGLTRKAEGNFYGTTYFGGSHGIGVVFRMTASGIYQVLYAFTGGADGGGPYGDLLLDQAGNLYGSATFGGAFGHGAIFRVTPAGKETVLYGFTGGADGSVPVGLSRDPRRCLSSVLRHDPAPVAITRVGVAFRLGPDGTYTVLHAFGGAGDGAYPTASLIQDSAGNLYGTTLDGGAYDRGIVFRTEPYGSRDSALQLHGRRRWE